MDAMRRAVAGLLLWALVGAAASGAAAAERVRIRAGEHDGFGRIVFDWDKPAGHRASIAGGRLTIVFDRPFEGDLAAIRGHLEDYLSDPRLDGTGKRFTAKLKGAYRVRSFVNDASVVIDLVALRSRPAATRKITVRGGEHRGFGRAVFDWPVPVGYRAQKEGGTLIIRFDQPASFDFGPFRNDDPPQFGKVETRPAGNGVMAVFAVAPDARIRHFRDGTRVVVDVLGSPAPEARAPPPPPSKTASPPIVLRPLPPPGKAARPKSVKSGQPPTFRPLVSVDVERADGGVVAHFNWLKPLHAAIFRRGASVWLVFERDARVDLGGLRVAGRDLISDARQVPVDGRSVLQFTIAEHIDIAARRDGPAWVVTFGGRTGSAAREHDIALALDAAAPTGTAVKLAFMGDPIFTEFRDPVIGDVLRLLLTEVSGQGHKDHQRFVEFEILDSPLGLAVLPLSDRLAVRRTGRFVAINGEGPLAVTQGNGPSGRPGAPERVSPLGGFWKWGSELSGDYIRDRQELMRQILVAPVETRNRARIDLAKFDIVHGFTAEAAGVLDITARQEPSDEERVEIEGLSAIVSFLLGQYGEAADLLNGSRFRNLPAARPWQAAIAAARGDWRTAYERFRETDAEIAGLPPRLARRLDLSAIEASLAVDDLEDAERRIDTLAVVELSPRERESLDYLRGFLLKKSNKLRPALDIWRGLALSKDRRIRARAKLAAINAEREAGRIGAEEAVERLEGLSFAWRGDSFEFDRIVAVAALYAEIGEYRRALSNYRRAASYFGKVEGSERVAEAMSGLFRKLYLDGEADKMEPVTALAVYREFRELTPAGREGDEMIRRLAERLVAVDLLGDAAKLLEEQIEYRLVGEEKARVGARLAAIRLLDRNPDAALAALESSAAKGISAPVRRERLYLRTQALTRLDRGKDALALLDGDKGRDADVLRLAIRWRENSWVEAARIARRLLKDELSRPANAAIDEDLARFATIWAVAAALSGDAPALDRLRQTFWSRMETSKSAYFDAFRAIVGRDLADMEDFRTLAQRAGGLSDFQAFLEGYRSRKDAVKAAGRTGG